MTQEKVIVTQEPVILENDQDTITQEPVAQKESAETQNLVVETKEPTN